MTILKPRKPRAMKTAEVEQLLHAASAAAANDLPEPSPDLVARAVERALASGARRVPSPSPFAPGGARSMAFGAVAFAGVVALAMVRGVPSSLRPSRPAAVVVTPPVSARTASPVTEANFAEAPVAKVTVPPRPSFVRPFVRRDITPSVSLAVPHRFAARYRRAQDTFRRNVATVRLATLPLSAPKPQTPALIVSPKIVWLPSARMVAVTAPKPRPFWHDEQVERDDYTVSAPAIVAEGTGQEVTSLTPAVVQVTFSTTQPVAANAAYNADGANP